MLGNLCRLLVFVIAPFVFTIWAWGWWWLLITGVILLLAASICYGTNRAKAVSAALSGVALFFVAPQMFIGIGVLGSIFAVIVFWFFCYILR